MRSKDVIRREIASHEAALRRLHDELRKADRETREELIREFDEGMSIAELSEAHGLGYQQVQGILYRAGRTQAGRTAIALRLKAVDSGAPA